jgi:hypothetical protein
MKKQTTTAVIDVYGNDLTKTIEQRVKDQMAKKLRNRWRYLRQYARRGEKL